MWILLVLIYGLLKGARDVIKKLALETNSTIEVLLVYTALAFIFVLPFSKDAFSLNYDYLPLIAIKSLCVCVAWICSFIAIKKMPISVMGILDLSRVLFATFLGVTVLNEMMSINQIIGLFLVCVGLLSLKYITASKNKESEDIKPIYVVMAFISCALNATSGLLDKILMKDITSSQLQFWYMLFVLIYYVIFALIKKEKITKSALNNKWIWALAILFVIADKALFIANSYPESKVTIMTLLKQVNCLVTIIGGKLIFKEKHISKKLICAAVIIIGIAFASI